MKPIGTSIQAATFDRGDGRPAPLASSASEQNELAEGTQVGAYVVRRKLGQGGMGTVYLAVHALLHKRVAVKVLAGDIPGASLTQRFLNEARASVAVDHPNIVAAFEFGQLPDGRLYYMMEYVDGRTLASRLADHDLDAEELRRLLLQLASAIEAAHARGIIHRDLKPENVLVAEPDHAASYVKVLDFGLVKMEGTEKLTRTGMQMGSPPYMAPEQCAGQPVDARVDLYALGVILYEVFAGRLPFDADFIRSHLTVPPPPPSRFAAVPPSLERLILDCLEKDPSRRPANAAVFRQRLIEALGPAGLGPAKRGGDRAAPSASAVGPSGETGAAQSAFAASPHAQTAAGLAAGVSSRIVTTPTARPAITFVRRGTLVGVALGATVFAAGVWYLRIRPAPSPAPMAASASAAEKPARANETPPPATALVPTPTPIAAPSTPPSIENKRAGNRPRKPTRESAGVNFTSPVTSSPVEPAPVAPLPTKAPPAPPGLIMEYPK
jgi:serine/threonine-protein kinase